MVVLQGVGRIRARYLTARLPNPPVSTVHATFTAHGARKRDIYRKFLVRQLHGVHHGQLAHSLTTSIVFPYPLPKGLRHVRGFPALRREVGGQASGMPTTPPPPSRTGQDPFSVIRLSRSPGWHASVRIVVRSDDFSKSTHADGAPTPCGPSPCPPHYRKAVRVLCPLRHRIPRGT